MVPGVVPVPRTRSSLRGNAVRGALPGQDGDDILAAIESRPPPNTPLSMSPTEYLARPARARALVPVRLVHRRKFLERFPNRLNGASELLLRDDQRGREPDDVTVRRFRLDQTCQSAILVPG